MIINKQQAITLICEALKDLGDEMRKPELAQASPETRLLGTSSALDSLALVALIAEIEARVAEKFETEMILADEKAMSQIRSPFRTVDALAAHIVSLQEDRGSK